VDQGWKSAGLRTERTERGFAIVRISTPHLEEGATPAVAADLELQGQPVVERLAVALTDLDRSRERLSAVLRVWLSRSPTSRSPRT
jgi:hypothetical protein